MRLFLVERHLSPMEADDLAAARRAILQACARISGQGHVVRHLLLIYVPGEGRLLCLLEAADEAIVRRANQIAQLPFQRIVPVITQDD